MEFASLGFDIDFAGEGTIEVKGTPADMPADAVDQMVYDRCKPFRRPCRSRISAGEKIAAVMARGGRKAFPAICRATKPPYCSPSSPLRAISVSRPRAKP